MALGTRSQHPSRDNTPVCDCGHLNWHHRMSGMGAPGAQYRGCTSCSCIQFEITPGNRVSVPNTPAVASRPAPQYRPPAAGSGQIKAIETTYAGCLFRSRLEARWAVFFDALGITWEYEPEGFETSSGWYLPDFRVWIPQVKSGNPQWFEVKPSRAPNDPRHAALAADSDIPVIIARGMPRDYADQLRGRSSALQLHWGTEPQPCAFVKRGRPRDAFYCALGDDRHWCQEHFSDCSLPNDPHLALACDNDITPPRWSPDVDQAYRAARSARFEHGQSGGML